MSSSTMSARLDEFWENLDRSDPAGAHARLEAVLADTPATDPEALFHRASLHATLGEYAQAAPLYRAALDHGLDASLRTATLIQLANALRSTGDPSGAMAILQGIDPTDPAADAARAYYALAQFSDGKPAAALRTALQTLSPYLPAHEDDLDRQAEEITAPDRVRVIAVGIVIRDGWVLAEEYGGEGGNRPFLRAPGGGVEFGESADRAIRREFQEELGVTVDEARLLGVTENIFDARGKRGHEIVYVYRVRSAALESLPLAQRLPVQDADTTVAWHRIDTLSASRMPFYPVGALELAI